MGKPLVLLSEEKRVWASAAMLLNVGFIHFDLYLNWGINNKNLEPKKFLGFADLNHDYWLGLGFFVNIK